MKKRAKKIILKNKLKEIKGLEEAYLFFYVNRFSFKPKEQLKYPSKIYLYDTGMASALSLSFSKDLGKLMENRVAIELKRQQKEFYYYKDPDNIDVDFVIKENNEVCELMQVSYDINNEKTKEREVKSLMKSAKTLNVKNLSIITWDYESVENAMVGVDYVFHAAALKQVPSCEFFPLEAVKTNVLGTDNVLTGAIEMGIKKVICLSTDKAAYPINAMGISKAMMEKVFVAKANTVDPTSTLICGTRYGNVMASRGSVIPLFIEQIKAGQPLTVTDPEMTRFLMSLEEAVELVIFAFQNSESGDIMVQKSPASTVGDLAQAIDELFNVHSDIKIIGTRHGEKQYETLLTKEEAIVAQDMGGFYRVPADKRDLNYEKYFSQGKEELKTQEDYKEQIDRLNITLKKVENRKKEFQK